MADLEAMNQALGVLICNAMPVAARSRARSLTCWSVTDAMPFKCVTGLCRGHLLCRLAVPLLPGPRVLVFQTRIG